MRRYLARVTGFIRGAVRHRSIVEDLVQIVFIKMLRQLPQLRDAAVFESWLFAIARCTVVDFMRKRRRQELMFEEAPPEIDVPDTSTPHRMREIEAALETALTRLPPIDRRLVFLFVEGHSYHAIAAREGLKRSTVRGRLNRIRPLLRVIVGEATGQRIATDTEIRAVRQCRLVA